MAHDFQIGERVQLRDEYGLIGEGVVSRIEGDFITIAGGEGGGEYLADLLRRVESHPWIADAREAENASANITAVVAAMKAELWRQAEAPGAWAPHVSDDERGFCVDGIVDLRALALAALEEARRLCSA